MAGTTVCERTTHLAMAHTLALSPNLWATVDAPHSPSGLAQDLCSAENPLSETGHHSLESAAARSGLSHDRASLQPARAILDHGSRACLRLQRLADKSSWTLLQELVQAVKQYGRPQFLHTDNEAVLVSQTFRFGLWLLDIRHQRIELGCPWQNGPVERFIGTVKRELRQDALTGDSDLDAKLTRIRQWYNHERPHYHLRGRTPTEVWARAREAYLVSGLGPLHERRTCPARCVLKQRRSEVSSKERGEPQMKL